MLDFLSSLTLVKTWSSMHTCVNITSSINSLLWIGTILLFIAQHKYIYHSSTRINVVIQYIRRVHGRFRIQGDTYLSECADC